MEHHGYDRNRLLRDAAITATVVVLAVLALDDITTDSALTFPVERTALAGCGVWCLVVAWRLWRQGHRVFGAMSAGLVIAAALAQPKIGPGTAPTTQVEYLATVGALAWFLLVAGALAWFAGRAGRRQAA